MEKKIVQQPLSFTIRTGSQLSGAERADLRQLDLAMWPAGDPAWLPEGCFRSLFQGDGLFAAYAGRQLAGCLLAIFVERADLEAYRNSHDPSALRRTEPCHGDANILYIHTANLAPAYRGTACMHELGQALVLWLDGLAAAGFGFHRAYAEAVTGAGASMLTRHLHMVPLGEIDAEGRGFYVDDTGLMTYRKEMRK